MCALFIILWGFSYDKRAHCIYSQVLGLVTNFTWPFRFYISADYWDIYSYCTPIFMIQGSSYLWCTGCTVIDQKPQLNILHCSCGKTSYFIHFMMWLQKLREFTWGKFPQSPGSKNSRIFSRNARWLGRVSQRFCASASSFRAEGRHALPSVLRPCAWVPYSVVHLPPLFSSVVLIARPWEPLALKAGCLPGVLQLLGFFRGILLPSSFFSANLRFCSGPLN